MSYTSYKELTYTGVTHTSIAVSEKGLSRRGGALGRGETSAWVSSHVHLRARLLFNKCALLFITYDSK